MGGINKHPSCKATWLNTTKASLHISTALAAVMNANTHLETALIGEFEGNGNPSDSIQQSLVQLFSARVSTRAAKTDLLDAIAKAEAEGSPYAAEFKAIQPDKLASLWNGTVVIGAEDVVRQIAGRVKQDHIEPMRSFCAELDRLNEMGENLALSFTDALDYARAGRLTEMLEKNEVPLQANFALFFSAWLSFMQKYLADSLIATHVAFKAQGHPALVAVA